MTKLSFKSRTKMQGICLLQYGIVVLKKVPKCGANNQYKKNVASNI